MAKSNRISLFFSVISLLCIKYTFTQVFTKDGKCPAVNTGQNCLLKNEKDTCFVDSECPGNQKCCDVDGCDVLSCTDPVFIPATCNIAVDLAFVVDASSSITPNNFRKIKLFMKNLASEFDIREGGAHIAAVVFGDKSQVVFDFNGLRGKDLTSEKMDQIIDRIPHLSGGNRIDLALLMAKTHVFSLNGGTRRNAPRILLLLTDGFVTQDSTHSYTMQSILDAADQLKSNGVDVFVVGIGRNVELSDLQEISSGPKKVFLSKGFKDLKNVHKEIAIRSCKACSDAVDIGFAIPSNSFAQFEDMKDFIKKTLDFFVIGAKNVQVGLIVYNNGARVKIQFDETYNLDDLKVKLAKILYVASSRGNRFDALFQTAANDLFTLRGGMRQGAAKKFIVVAEKPIVGSQRDIDDGVEQLRSLGVDIIGVTYGSDTSKSTMKKISSFPVKENYKEAPAINDLLSQVPRSVVESSCKGKGGKCPYTKVPAHCSNSFQECQVDLDCKDDQKCCQNGCDRRCKAPVQGCFRAFEIAFLVDTSFTISDEELHRMKDFMKEIANGFSISETGTRFSIVTYNKEATILLNFNDNFNAKNIVNEIDKVDKTRNRQRRLDIGLQLTQSDVFSLKGGIRQGVPLVLIVLSGGWPSSNFEKLKRISTSLKNSVNIWTIGSGPSASAEYLKEIASKEEQSHKSIFFEQLFPVASEITGKLCSDKSGRCPRPIERFCVDQKDDCVSDYECPGFSKCCNDGCRKKCSRPSWECQRPLDLAIVMESSRNIGYKNFQVLKLFTKDLVKALKVGHSKTEIALLTYSEYVSKHLDFNKFKGIFNKEVNILRAIDRLLYTGGSGGAAHKALQFAYRQLFRPEGGSRANAVRGLIFITDGLLEENNEKIYKVSMSLKRAGVAIYPVSASKSPNLAALERIASDSSTDHVFLATSLPAIIQYVHQLSKEACKGEAPPKEIHVVKGPPGDPGPRGEKGLPGPQGPPGKNGGSGHFGGGGERGTTGTSGQPGVPGTNGRPGPPGPVYIQMSRQGGNGKTQTVILPPVRSISQTGTIGRTGIKGPVGSTGSHGRTGEPGDPGTPGVPGRRGGMGAAGRKGPSGLIGSTGSPGGQGKKGSTGDQGLPGQKGLNGAKGNPGMKGDIGIHGEEGKPGVSGLPGVRGKRGRKGTRGNPGVIGKMGPQGTIGERGRNGVEGDLGPEGPIGDTGLMGSMGKMGKKGERGSIGLPGPRGMPGESGSAGPAGFNGAPAADGRKGAIGDPGAKGSVGDPGTTGVTGKRGPIGAKGLEGAVGPPGSKGQMGKDGKDGDQGLDGAKGTIGNMGVPGIDGVSGPKGKRGIEGDTGFAGPEGNEGERGIQGSEGFVGTDGPTGTKGKNGNRGIPGRNGRKGSRGRSGKFGAAGKSGRRGIKGRVGRTGDDGKQGEIGAPGDNGNVGPAGEKGSQGYFGIKGQIGLKGSPGSQGLAGPAGVLGGQGPKGSKGLSGDSGNPGFLGSAGEQGPRGADGEEGLPGSQGSPGSQGNKGARGLLGDKGPIGDLGNDGGDGEQGQRGKKGDEGEIGIPGLDGTHGFPGDRGPVGNFGPQGPSGFSGSPGLSGISGLEGDVGRPGLSGEKGKKGDIGIQGITGVPGADGDPGLDGLSGPAGPAGLDGEKGGEGIPGIVGGEGAIGAKGVKGLAGAPGPAGTPGLTGSRGLYGAPGELGSRGIKGEAGILGSAGLPGHDGEPGEYGPVGHPGIRGERGLRGTTGPEGSRGPMGFPGPTGSRGDRGVGGDFGVLGEKGKTGDAGDVGKTGPTGPQGLSGKPGIPGELGDVAPQGISGIPGSPGIAGPRGSPGNMGLTGRTGVHGEQGQIGIPGENGKPGPDGEDGDQGVKGDQGYPGTIGEVGLKGPRGPSGNRGNRGREGLKGLLGEKGPTGNQGQSGAIGSIGYEGRQGPIGIPGEKGDGGSEGVNGPPGLRGAKGRKGYRGYHGPYGTDGIKGIRGESGPTGFEGLTGRRGEKGNYGRTGNIGEKGVLGDKGPAGPAGEKGNTGPVEHDVIQEGVDGQIGVDGLTGVEGPKGHRGRRGPPGPPGPSGGSLNSDSTSTTGGSPSSDSGPPDYYHGVDKHGNKLNQNRIPNSKQVIEMEFLASLERLHNDFSNFKKPTGTKFYPALTCKNLFNDHSHLKSGNYWIDPNEGAPEDALLVYCDLEKKSSCIFPVTPKTQVKQWFRGKDGYKWFKEEIDDTFKFRYSAEGIQLTFLQLLSDKVLQNITYHCIKSTVWQDQTGNADNSIKFLGDNEREYRATTPRKHRPIVLRDDCKIKDNKKRITVIEILTKNTARLPIRDIAVYDIGDDSEQFGLELGPVCFS